MQKLNLNDLHEPTGEHGGRGKPQEVFQPQVVFLDKNPKRYNFGIR